MNTTAEVARAEQRKTAADAPPIPLVDAPRFLGYDDQGKFRTISCGVGRALPEQEARRLLAELDGATTAGRQAVTDAVAEAVALYPSVAAQRAREGRLIEARARYGDELTAAERTLNELRQAAASALADGRDPGPSERQAAEIAEQVQAIRGRVAGTEAGLTAAANDLNRVVATVGREVRVKLYAQAEAEFNALAASVAASLFNRLHRLTELRGMIAAARD